MRALKVALCFLLLPCAAAVGEAPYGVYTLPPAKLASAIHLYHLRTALYFGGTAWTILILWLLVRARAGEHVASLAKGLSERRWLQGLLVAPAWLLLLSIIGLPAESLSHAANLHYGLSIEGWPCWLWDWTKSTLIFLAVGTVVVSVLYALMRHSNRRWWLWFWILTLPAELFAIFAVPVFIDPLFNHFEPLQKYDPALVAQMERVVARGNMHIPPSRMFVMNASAKSTGLNAYVTGFGASKRVVVWDTTIKSAPPDEILFVYGHEQGHYVLHHIQKGLLYSAVLTFAFFWIGYRLLRWIVRRRGHAWHVLSVDNWTSLGALLLVATVLGFFAEPLGNYPSRMEEHHADIYGQEVIHGLVKNPQQTAVRDFQLLGEAWLEVPQPNRFVVFWTYSHPPVSERERFAAHYDPWLPGRHPRYFDR